ncbi:TolC family protein [Reichenbachiella carrageenanivorans]|uniref:TolC family protein n=1 Tax=Reichenbachiella carrageenanivorans TaxID=2979869 RepID=A0ABY6D342_9BACT|nr:TolC family protein [Reichenbachiella carrageenanivorans]UXX79518.1 TolC family protein [Reichenbachiella carrageenanivorans]
MRVIKQPIFHLILTISLVAAHQVSYAQESTTFRFSLEEAINYALDNNQRVKNAQLEEEIADRQVGEIIADGLPQLNANANLFYNYKIQQSLIEADGNFPPGVPAGETVALEFGIPYTSSFDVALSQMLFDGSFFIGLEAAKTFTQLSKKDHIKTKIDVAEAVSKAYFLVLVNRERFGLIERNYSRLDSLLSDTKVMYSSGFAEKIDVNRVQVQFNNVKVEKENYEQVLNVSESLLKFQMGLNHSEELELTSTIEGIDYFDFADAANFTYEQRVEYDQMNINKELKELDIKNVRAKYYPKLDLIATYGQNTGNTSFGDLFSDQWFGLGAIGVKATVPIFDGLRKRRQVQQRQLQVQQIDYSLNLLKNNIDVEIESALADYNRSIEMMEAQRENMELSQEVYEVAKIKYNEGVGSNIEVIDADATYKQAQINFYNALYDALVSKIDLQKAYGVLL